MNGYLVLGQCGCDNVPLRFTATLEEAEAVAAVLTADGIIQAASDVLDCDVSWVVGVAIVPFKDGIPGMMKYIRDIEDEAAVHIHELPKKG